MTKVKQTADEEDNQSSKTSPHINSGESQAKIQCIVICLKLFDMPHQLFLCED